MNLSDFRKNYALGRLYRSDLEASPIEQFKKWMDEMLQSDLPEPTAMILATSDVNGLVDQRYVLLKGVSNKGFMFFTDTHSKKGQELENNPNCSLLFPWHSYERQIRIQGRVTPLAREQVADYFASRPHGSQLAAFTSMQSRSIKDRASLDANYLANSEQYTKSVPLPDRWGGYLVEPQRLEFWQGGEHRLHDRLVYIQNGSDWQIERLQP